MNFTTVHRIAIQAGGGAALLFYGKHVAFSVLLAQSFRALALPAVSQAFFDVMKMVDMARAEIAAADPAAVAAAARVAASASAEYHKIKQKVQDARAAWRDGTASSADLAALLKESRSAAAALAADVAGSEAALGAASAIVAAVEPEALFASCAAALTASAAAVAAATSSSASAMLNGCAIGSDAARLLSGVAAPALQNAALLAGAEGSGSSLGALVERYNHLPPAWRKWADAARGCRAGKRTRAR